MSQKVTDQPISDQDIRKIFQGCQSDFLMLRDELENLPADITKEEVLSHIISPEHTRDIPMESVDEAQEKRFPIPHVPKIYRAPPHLDLAAFGQE